MMLRFYPAVIDKSDDSDFGISFPDFPGCVTADPDLQTALNQAAEALSLHVDGMLEDGEAIPLPSAPDFVGDDKWVMVPLVIGTSLPVSPVTFAEDETSATDTLRGHFYSGLSEILGAQLRQTLIRNELHYIQNKALSDAYVFASSSAPPKSLSDLLERRTHLDEDTFLMGSLGKTATAKPFSPASLKTRKTAQKPKPVTK